MIRQRGYPRDDTHTHMEGSPFQSLTAKAKKRKEGDFYTRALPKPKSPTTFYSGPEETASAVV